MAASILDGKALADEIRGEVAMHAAILKAGTGIAPRLAAVLVGDVAASQVYVRNKEAACRAAGIAGEVVRLPGDASEAAILDEVDRLNADPGVHGILVQLPLPGHVDERKVIARIDPLKDVDGFHPENLGRLAQGSPRFVPCTPLGIREMLTRSGVATAGRHAVVLGRSNIVGKPMALLLMNKGDGADATVTVCHSATPDVAEVARTADILIAAVGRPEIVRGGWIKPGATVIDVGIHRRDDGSLCGDVHFAEASEVAGLLSPVPGGVGRMTVAMLLWNTLIAARLALP